MSMFTTAKKANDDVMLLHNLQLNSYLKIKDLRSKLKLYEIDSGETTCQSKVKAKFKNTEQKLLELNNGKFKPNKNKKVIQLL